ncbi:glutamate receptor 1 [Bactrocera tryoni]|uniref:glutamate receptor 1 n=1 Tax=Bactrocera tryoni TaxID=59916 RepID=UPI001A96DA2B|nr:glutamate receptor 1 [Bactrocera tryoni]
MAATKGATTARRQTLATALLCGRTSLITTVILLLSKCNLCVSAAANAYEFDAFADVLKQQHLHHAIIAYNSDTEQAQQQAGLLKDNALRALLNVASLQFYDVHQAKSAKNATDFQRLFYHDSPRVGIYVAQLEDVLLQQYVLGSNVISVDTIDAGGYRVRVDVGSRFNSSRIWFIMSKQRTVTAALANVRRVMTPLPVNISADITIGVRLDGNNTIQLFDIYKIQKDWLDIEPKGYWSPAEGLKLNLRFHQTFVNRRRNFKGLQLVGGIVIREQPADMTELDYLNSLYHKNFDPMQRKTYQLVKLMEPIFDVSFQPALRKTWGEQAPNGSWDGVMKLLLSGEAEFSLCPMRFVPNRVHLIHYTIAVHTEFVFFIFRHPHRNDIRNIFFEPFVEEVWYTVIAIVVLTILLLQLHLHHENRFFINKDPHFQTRFDYAIFSILEAFFQQGPSNDAFTATSTRTLIFSVCLFSLLLQQFYGAFIVGSLLSVSPRTITNLEALYNSSLDIGIENIPYNIETFEKTTVPLGMAIYKERVCKNRERNILYIEEGAERIKKGGFAFHVSANRMYYILKELLSEKEFCDLQDVPFIPPYRIGIGITKSSPFREYFTTSIAKFHTSGLLQHNDNQWQLPQLDCSLSQNYEVEVDLQHFLPALLFLVSAMLLSLAVLILEIIYYNLEKSTKLARLCPRIMPKPKLEFIN